MSNNLTFAEFHRFLADNIDYKPNNIDYLPTQPNQELNFNDKISKFARQILDKSDVKIFPGPYGGIIVQSNKDNSNGYKTGDYFPVAETDRNPYKKDGTKVSGNTKIS